MSAHVVEEGIAELLSFFVDVAAIIVIEVWLNFIVLTKDFHGVQSEEETVARR
jgi:hypothetical protein